MSDQKISVGDRIKRLRQEKGLSIAEVSESSGVDASVIASIEDLTISPPLGNIISLAKAFRVSLGDLFGDDADSPFCIVRSDDRKTVNRFSSAEGKSGGYHYESLGHQKQNRQMEPFLVTLVPLQELRLEPNQHDGEEILFVLEGKVEVRLGDHADILNQGDSIYYDSTIPHVVSCYGETPARILAVIYAKKDMIIL